MSKITKEEALERLKEISKYYTNDFSISKKYQNQRVREVNKLFKEIGQPQLSDNVEKALSGLETMGDKDLYNGVHIQIKNCLEQYIQTQASEIERLKEQLKEQEQ